MERRAFTRYALSVPVLFNWQKEDGGCQGGGFARDVSMGGAYILCPATNCPVVRAAISIEVLLPTVGVSGAGLKLSGQGQVVRTGSEIEPPGFAVMTKFGIRGSHSEEEEEIDLPLAIVRTSGVLRWVGSEMEPAAIPDSEIAGVRPLLANNILFWPHAFLKIGQRVRIRGGPLNGCGGSPDLPVVSSHAISLDRSAL